MMFSKLKTSKKTTATTLPSKDSRLRASGHREIMGLLARIRRENLKVAYSEYDPREHAVLYITLR